jgi:hypothetical protein
MSRRAITVPQIDAPSPKHPGAGSLTAIFRAAGEHHVPPL